MPVQSNRSVMITLFAVVGCLWFGLHAAEYVAARYEPIGSLLSLPEGYGLSSLIQSVPAWASGAIGATVWLGLLGSVLLLLQDRAAVLVLSLTFLASLVALVWSVMAMADGLLILGGVNVVQFAAALAAVSGGCWLYARVAKRSGTL
ncbi:hypothetical protein [Roseibaca sp. Y0-43]|uniref:hypothetical protein n=1 Tax=Roseibaca sp. Y0-43 TaxID=2816854 RepID=UPI001D0BF84B|nr:hypothetical protein [Roseibaca sp. Y0-43]MCC1480679.1 hypothetical protein [Roseibaca sp. Y0-43]